MHTPAFTTAANRNSTTAQNRIANDVSKRALKSCAYTRTLYSKICPSNASEHKPILTAANGSAFFRLASAMSGSTSESIPQVRLPTEHITEIEIVVDIFVSSFLCEQYNILWVEWKGQYYAANKPSR